MLCYTLPPVVENQVQLIQRIDRALSALVNPFSDGGPG